MIQNKLDAIEQKRLNFSLEYDRSYADDNLYFSMIDHVWEWVNKRKVDFVDYSGDFIRYILRLDNLVSNVEMIKGFQFLKPIHSILIRDVVNCKSLYLL